MPACYISYMKFLFVLAQLETADLCENALCKLSGTCYCFIYYFN